MGKHPKVRELMNAFSSQRPPIQQFQFVWDVDQMLEYLLSLGENSELSFKTLSMKAAMLVALLAFSRQSEISYLSVDRISRTDRSIAFFFDKPIKNSKRIPKPLVFHRFNDQPRLCPVSTLDHFIRRSSGLRSSNSLFVKLIKPHDGVCPATIGSWIKHLLVKIGVDVNKFQGHSTRSSASSMAAVRGASVKDIMDRGLWKESSTWQSFYNKNIQDSPQSIQTALLGVHALKEGDRR